MKKTIAVAFCSLALACGSLAACSKSDEPLEEEKGRIEQFTDEVAEDAVNAIEAPMDKARGIRDMSKRKLREMQEQE